MGSPFKAYDVRGKLGEDLDEARAEHIGLALCAVRKPTSAVVGYDARLSSPGLKEALIRGLQKGGCTVTDIGLCGTEEIYFATSHLGVDLGVIVTASHNPIDYNGMKFVGPGSTPISRENGLAEVENLVMNEGEISSSPRPGALLSMDTRVAFATKCLSFIKPAELKPLRILCDAGNGVAGPALNAIIKQLKEAGSPLEFVQVRCDPDGTFPTGIPNPLLPECRDFTAAAVREHRCDLGLAWDGDFDRCFFFDEQGEFIEGYYLVGLLAEAFLIDHPGAKIIHDPRLTWNTIDIVQASGGQAIQSRTGHAFIKQAMRDFDAVYGGEMSAHHYFRDFYSCDSGMIPWLLVVALMSKRGQSLSSLVAERQCLFPCSGEINRQVADIAQAITRIEAEFAPVAIAVDRTDGLSMDLGEWRFNLRASNTEPLLRLNVESRGDRELMERMTQRLLRTLENAHV
ncbi:MAG: hypothetical protein RL095_390 [Verrucomicrobiota bacterium]|jgi:phosphomannomutase